jgi:hypothetical protein
MAVSPLDHASSSWAAPRSPSRSRRAGRVRAALNASLHGWELDRQLAAGCDPESDAALAVRARRITSSRSRRRIADGLARVVGSVEPAPRAFTAAARPDGAEVIAARTVLMSLERRLRGEAQIAPAGAAMLGLLLIDCTGPLYQPTAVGELGSRLRAAAAALEPAGRREHDGTAAPEPSGREDTSVPVAPEAARDEALR